MSAEWEILVGWADKIGTNLTQDKLQKFQTYYQLLLDWNQKINLVSRQDTDRIISYHFIDSISSITEIPKDSIVCDLRTGAGLPGIPIKILRDDITLYLLESIKKKGCFLQEVIKTLMLEKTFLLLKRAEAIKDKKFDIILVRLFGKIFDVLPLASKLLNRNGKIIFYKIEGIEKEVERAKKVAGKTHLQIKTIKDIKLPVTEITRKVVTYAFATDLHR